jgi:hypothetical protein
MIPVNPGNLLPFYNEGYNSNDRRWQRHRQIGTDVFPYGLPCPRTRLLPFQVSQPGGAPVVFSFALFNPEDDTDVILLDTALLDVQVDLTSGSERWWVTWKADADLDVIPDCGYWYIFLNLGDEGQYYSEVLDCRDMCGFETVALTIQADSCAVEDPSIQFVLEAGINTGSGTTYVIQRKVGLSFETIATNASATVVDTLSNETEDYRIQATTVCGLIITKTYTVTWDSADGCGTLAIALTATSTNEAGILTSGPVWRLNFSNTKDKGTVLYQTGYEQYLYLPMPIWDVPEIVREVETTTNGNGEEIRRFTRTVERRGFEVADLPDYVLGWLTKAGDLDTIKMEDAKLVDALAQVEFAVENLTFESPGRQGVGLNIGRFYFDVEAEAFQGCQEDYVLD